MRKCDQKKAPFVASRRKISSAFSRACEAKCPDCLHLPHRKNSSGGARTLATCPPLRPQTGGLGGSGNLASGCFCKGRPLRCSIGAGAGARSRHVQHPKQSGGRDGSGGETHRVAPIPEMLMAPNPVTTADGWRRTDRVAPILAPILHLFWPASRRTRRPQCSSPLEFLICT